MKQIISRGAEQFSVRFPDGMRDRIKAQAAGNRRSMNSEILDLLERALSSSSESNAGVQGSAENISRECERRGECG